MYSKSGENYLGQSILIKSDITLRPCLKCLCVCVIKCSMNLLVVHIFVLWETDTAACASFTLGATPAVCRDDSREINVKRIN